MDSPQSLPLPVRAEGSQGLAGLAQVRSDRSPLLEPGLYHSENQDSPEKRDQKKGRLPNSLRVLRVTRAAPSSNGQPKRSSESALKTVIGSTCDPDQVPTN